MPPDFNPPDLHPWFWRCLPLQQRSGATVFAALFPAELTGGIRTLLESPAGSATQPGAVSVGSALKGTAEDSQCLTRYSICAGPPRRLGDQLRLWTPRLGAILPCLQQLLSHRPPDDLSQFPEHLPFVGGWLGWLGYDLAWELERLPWQRVDSLPFPVAYWYEPAEFAVLDHQAQELWLAASEPYRLDVLQQRLETTAAPEESLTINNLPPIYPHFALSQPDYEVAVLQAKKYIRAGDIFQANLSLRFAAQGQLQSWDLYRRLQRINPSPFASYWQTPWGAVVSCSPERLVQLQGRTAQTRPIAGTRPRGATPEQEQQLATELRQTPKEIAEHIMLVDLERNDLGRVCEWGSVRVDELLAIETYSHVMHLVSNIVGTLAPGANAVDLIRAFFPGGTITGCPKVRCLEIIEELEPVRRNLFYGSCGYLDRRGNLDLNILIRTLLVTPVGRTEANASPTAIVWGQVGAGIVADSQPEQEWYESLQKAQAQLAALQVNGP